ncbi:hypothetical protein HQ563_13430 [bacterium]|nr:hypothetical protein [bacterium]
MWNSNGTYGMTKTEVTASCPMMGSERKPLVKQHRCMDGERKIPIMRRIGTITSLMAGVYAVLCTAGATAAENGVFVRLKLLHPQSEKYFVRLGGHIHISPWYLRRAVIPYGADGEAAKRLATGEWTGWFDLKAHAGELLHGRLNRAGGVAEFPNITAEFVTEGKHPRRVAVIELATAPVPERVVKRFEESFTGSRTTFLVSPDLAKDADSLESLSQMEQRHLEWARGATGGIRVSPKNHIIQTSFYGPTVPGAEVLWLLGFNVVGNQTNEIHEKFPELRLPGQTHDVDFGPGATRESIDALMKKHAQRFQGMAAERVPFNFADEVCCRPRIGDDPKAIEHFHGWLGERNIAAKALGVSSISDIVPIETPEALRQREQTEGSAARRVFYYTSRFRQQAGTERIRWHTETFHKYFPSNWVTSTLVADHPYFGGTGLGMGMTPNTTWGGAPLALDWFDLARSKAVDLIGIEDWMGLQYMYGPNYTWEGFQLMGFQASIFRSGSCGTLPIIAWITPSDETNLRLKCASALCQGAKHFFYWTYGPTAFGTENYWSDLHGEYDGIAKIVRQLAAAEHILAPGKVRKTRVALLYSISSDLWQPFGYIHMLERRATYLSLVHQQYLVDMLTEEDVAAGRLRDYDVLYVTDPCISAAAVAAIEGWVHSGGYLYGSCAAGSRNEFNEPVPGLARAFGISPEVKTEIQAGEYRVRGELNSMEYIDLVRVNETDTIGPATQFGVVGTKVYFAPTSAKVVGTFGDGTLPAVAIGTFGRGRSAYFAACPGVSYLKAAKFVPDKLKEKYPATERHLINSSARARGAARLVELSHPVVEAGVYDAQKGTALVLANFTYEPITDLTVRLPVGRMVKCVRSVENGALKFSVEDTPEVLRKAGFGYIAAFETKLGLNDIILLE